MCEAPCGPFRQKTPDPETVVIAKNRYLSFVPGNPGELTALRVKLTDMPSPFEDCNGKELWARSPSRITEASGSSADTPEPTFWVAALESTSNPVFRDWSDVDVLNVYGAAIVAGGAYQVQAIFQECDRLSETNFSAGLDIPTGKWGDPVGAGITDGVWASPQGVVDFIDISVVVDKFMENSGAPRKVRTDLAGDTVDRIIDFVDISAVVDAFMGADYPFDGPICP